MTTGGAENSMNGFHYQRLYTILLILESFSDPEIIEVMEEKIEDCDFYCHNNKKILNQIKYHNSYANESITKDSGLYKVIKRNETIENINNIEKINYISYSQSENVFDNLNKYFEKTDESYDALSKYLQMTICKDLSKNTILSDLKISSNFDKINEIYEENKDEFLKSLSDTSNNKFNSLLLNKKQYKNYFSKFELVKGLSYKSLINEIHNQIKLHYYKNEDTKYNNLVIIRMLIYNLLMDNMFNDNNSIKINEIKNNSQINEFINNKLNNIPLLISNHINNYIDKINDVITEDNFIMLKIYIDDIIKLYNNENNDEYLILMIKLINKYIQKDNSNDSDTNKLKEYKCLLCFQLVKKIIFNQNKYPIDLLNKIFHISQITFKKSDKKSNYNNINTNLVDLINKYNKGELTVDKKINKNN